MGDRALASLFVLAIWWLSTGLVLRMVWRGRSTLTIASFTVLAAGGLLGLFASSRVQSPAAAYLAFISALSVWGWQELIFLLGLVTGPRKIACPAGARGWRRFLFATEAVIHHEVALATTMLAIFALTWREPNQVGTSTFFVLWTMRLSAKLNVFLGVRNVSEHFVPEHLRYLLSYFRRARMNWLMPASLLGATAMVVHLGASTAVTGLSAFSIVGRTLVTTILALAVLEHLFLALPVPDAALWQWAVRAKPEPAASVPAFPIEAP